MVARRRVIALDAPEQLVENAARAGLDVVALTDHDTAAGVEEALAFARESPLRVISGIEISTCYPPHELHVLGYCIDPRAPSILAHQHSAERRREERMERMVRGLPGRLGRIWLRSGARGLDASTAPSPVVPAVGADEA